MKIRGAYRCLIVAAGGVLAAGRPAKTRTSSQAAQKAPESDKQETLIRSVDGADLYQAYCASCHGKNGKGDGPVAALKATLRDHRRAHCRCGDPPDLVRRDIDSEPGHRWQPFVEG